MSRIKDARRQLETAWEAMEALEADLAAGRVPADEHRRLSAEREREIGRLFVRLRRAQGEARAQQRPEAATAGGSSFRGPVPIVVGALILIAVGVGAGLLVARSSSGTRGGAAAPGTASPVAGGLLSGVPGGVDAAALRQMVARGDAPIADLLQVAHVALDQGRIDEARQGYEHVLSREPRNAEAINHMGTVLYQQGRVDEALARIEEALRIDPGYIHAHWDKTQFLFHGKKDYPAVIKAADAFLAVLPEGPDADVVRNIQAQAREGAAKATAPAAKGR